MPPAWPSWWSSSPSRERPSTRPRNRPKMASLETELPSPPASWSHSLEARWEPSSDLLPPSSMDPSLVRRQQNTIVIIPTTYSDMDDGPPPGTVVGAVLGSVFGFLVILYVIYSCLNRGGGPAVEEEDIVVRERRGSRSSRHSHSHSHSHSRSSPPVPRSPIRTESRVEERIIVEETRRAATRSPEDDIVEVIEEEEEAPPRRSRGSRSRPTSGYRSIDPDRFAGGNHPMEEVYTRRSSRRR